MSKLTMTTLKGLLWSFAGTGSNAVIQLGVIVVLARLLTPKDFGLVAAALVIVNFAAIFTQLGVGPAIVQRPRLETSHLRVAFTVSCLLGVAFTVVTALLAGVISGFFGMPELKLVIQIMSGTFLLKSIAVVPDSLMRRELQFRQLAIIEIFTLGFGFGTVGIVLALIGCGVWSLVIAYMAQYALTSLILLLVKPHAKAPSLDLSALGELLKFGGGLTITHVCNYMAVQGDNLVIGRSLGADALGIYGRAYQFMAAPAMLVGQVLDNVLFPAMAKVQEQPERLGIVYRRGVSFIASVTLPLSVVIVILAPEIIDVLLGAGWEQVVLPFQVLAIGTMFRTSYKMSDSLSRATGAVYRQAWRHGVYALSVVFGAYFGSNWGLVGASVGVLCALTIHFILMTQLSLRLTDLGLRNFLIALASPFLLTAVVALQAWFLVNILRTQAFSAFHTIFVILLVISITTLFLCLMARRMFIGQDGLWILHSLSLLMKGKSLESENV